MAVAFFRLNLFKVASRSARKASGSLLVLKRLVFSFRPRFEKLAIRVFVPPISTHKYIS